MEESESAQALIDNELIVVMMTRKQAIQVAGVASAFEQMKAAGIIRTTPSLKLTTSEVSDAVALLRAAALGPTIHGGES